MMSDAEFIVKLEAQITQDKADSDQSKEELQAQIDELRTGYAIVRDKSTEYLKMAQMADKSVEELQAQTDELRTTMHNQVYLAEREAENLESLNLKLFEDTKRLETQLHNATSEKSVILNQAEHWKEKYHAVLAEKPHFSDDDDRSLRERDLELSQEINEQEIERLSAQIKEECRATHKTGSLTDDQLKTQLAELQDVCSMRKEAIDVLRYWCRVLNRNIRTDDDSLQAMVSKAVNSLL